MRYMIIVRASAQSEAGIMPTEAKLAEMAAYHQELAEAGVLLDGSGLMASAHGWRVRQNGPRREVVDGPFAETKELIAGFTLIKVASREEALAWSQRFPNPTPDDSPCEIEVRRMFELEDFEQGPAIRTMRQIGLAGE